VGERVVTARAVARGQALAAEDLRSERAEIAGVPVRRLPGLAQLVGSRALRVLPEGAVVLENAVSLRRAVEPGDAVSVVAAAGAVEVTATFIAADGGDPGAVIRVVNPETRRYVRARVKEDAVVEVIDAR
jgi:flagella basal body P-ring formation protein FlgA